MNCKDHLLLIKWMISDLLLVHQVLRKHHSMGIMVGVNLCMGGILLENILNGMILIKGLIIVVAETDLVFNSKHLHI